MDIEQYVRVVDAHVRAFACLVAEVIHNGILYLVCYELAVAELVAEYHGIHRKALGVVQVVFPSDGLDVFIYFVGCVGLEVLDGLQNAYGRSQAEVCLVHQGLVTRKSHHTVTYLNVTGSQLSKFFGQHFFQSVEGFGYQLEFFLHKGM